jgi:anti-sigma regulatory factor (Ser/Thr protein kinase)
MHADNTARTDASPSGNDGAERSAHHNGSRGPLAARSSVQHDVPFELHLAAELEAGSRARAAVRSWLSGRVADRLLDDALLIVTELVTNSVRHVESDVAAVVSVRVAVDGDVLRLEVEDCGTGATIARRAPDPHNGGGFGLHLVDVLAADWGIDRLPRTRVWVELGFAGARG